MTLVFICLDKFNSIPICTSFQSHDITVKYKYKKIKKLNFGFKTETFKNLNSSFNWLKGIQLCYNVLRKLNCHF